VGGTDTAIGGAAREPPHLLNELLGWQDADESTARPVVFELHTARDLGEERIVFAETDVGARLEATPALTHENRSARNEIAVVPLDAEALRVAIAAVSGAALPLFVCHDKFPTTLALRLLP
jgi:hypothetical protein